jgi:hypothetical protein
MRVDRQGHGWARMADPAAYGQYILPRRYQGGDVGVSEGVEHDAGKPPRRDNAKPIPAQLVRRVRGTVGKGKDQLGRAETGQRSRVCCLRWACRAATT